MSMTNIIEVNLKPYLERVQQVMLLTKALGADKQVTKYGTNSPKCGIMPLIQPSAIAPRARIPDSLISHSE